MTAYVLMAALPPTKGHLRLIQFASCLADNVTVIVCTQPDEPFPFERAAAIRSAARDLNVEIQHLHKQLEQNPDAPGFWDMWRAILKDVLPTDIIVASEEYGQRVAEATGAKFMPYDIDRAILPCKATMIRSDPARYFSNVMPTFQRYLRQTVTLFGAESTGKTTLSKSLANTMGGHWLMEWARPYLETCGTEITTEAMTDIWAGQRALQAHARLYFQDKPWIFQDTDLFSTVGYWDFWNMNTPKELTEDAAYAKSDLYLITKSNIPFEADPIRYGGHQRESTDEYWVRLCEYWGLNYRVIESDGHADRLYECYGILNEHWKKNVVDRLTYVRLY